MVQYFKRTQYVTLKTEFLELYLAPTNTDSKKRLDLDSKVTFHGATITISESLSRKQLLPGTTTEFSFKGVLQSFMNYLEL